MLRWLKVATQTDECLALIDQIAVAISQIPDPETRYLAGRAVLVERWTQNPKDFFVLEQATAYLLARCQHEWE